MPQKKEFSSNTGVGEPEVVQVNILSELLQDLADSGALSITDDGKVELIENDMIVIGIPDTGAAKFIPAGQSKPDKDGKTKATKACFIVAEMGGWQAGEGIDFRQSAGDVEGLPLTVRMSVVAQVPNNKGTTIDEALNRKPQLIEVPPQAKTGTDN